MFMWVLFALILVLVLAMVLGRQAGEPESTSTELPPRPKEPKEEGVFYEIREEIIGGGLAAVASRGSFEDAMAVAKYFAKVRPKTRESRIVVDKVDEKTRKSIEDVVFM